jgi:hypothetical protein
VTDHVHSLQSRNLTQLYRVPRFCGPLTRTTLRPITNQDQGEGGLNGRDCSLRSKFAAFYGRSL